MKPGTRHEWWLAAAAYLILVASVAGSSLVSSTEIVPPDPVIFQGFGNAVAIDADTAVVGAHEGAYVYERRSGEWVFLQKLSPDEPLPDPTNLRPQFGKALAIDGNQIAVGAPNWPSERPDAGAVFLFGRRRGSWVQNGVIRGVGFGHSLALQSGTLAIGASGDGRTDTGMVRMFARYRSNWREQEVMMGSLQTRVGSRAGVSISVDGNTAVVGVAGTGPACVYVLVRRGNTWSQEAKLEEGGGPKSVAMEGDTVVIGTPMRNDVAIYARTEEGWILQQRFTAGSGTAYGASVSLKNDRLLIGQPWFSGQAFHNGAAHLFLRDQTGGWTFAEELSAGEVQVYNELGTALAQSDTAIVAGLPLHVVSEVAAGAARIYEWPRPRIKLDLPANIMVEATSARGAIGTFAAKAYDATGAELPVNLSMPSGSMFPLGTTVIRASTMDVTGEAATGTFTVRVRDSQPPAMRQLSVSPRILWPPDRRLVIVKVSARAVDSVDLAPSVRIDKVASNEPGVIGDWQSIDDLTLRLRAERSMGGTGRIYTITVEARDTAGNVRRQNVLVSVP
jgi:hypothetical protein